MVTDGDFYDYEKDVKQIFLDRKDAEKYIKLKSELAGEKFGNSIVEFELQSYQDKEPCIIYEHVIRYFSWDNAAYPPKIELNINKALDTDVPGTIVFYGDTGHSIEIIVPFEQAYEIEPQRAILLCECIRKEIQDPKDFSFEKEISEKNYQKFKYYVSDMFKSVKTD